MNEEQHRNIYSNLIGGRLPYGSASPMRVVLNQAQAILGTNRLHVYFYERAGFLYYFAIESKHLASNSNFLLPFADALPDGPGHQGDGIYLLKADDFAAAMVIDHGNMQLLCNELDVLNDYLLGFDLPQFSVDQLPGKPLRSVPQTLHGVSERVGRYLLRGSAGVLLVAALAFVGVHTTQIFRTSQDNTQASARVIEADLAKTLGKLNVQQPLARQISRVQVVSATVIRSGGWIQKYSLKGEDVENFEVVLPSWVSQDYLDSLGRDVVTDLRDMEGLLTVRKVVKEKVK